MCADETSISYSSKSISDPCAILSTQIFRILLLSFKGINCPLMSQKHRALILGTAPTPITWIAMIQTIPHFQINGEKIESTGNIKYLGVQHDGSINRKEQINVAISKSFPGTGTLKVIEKLFSAAKNPKDVLEHSRSAV